MYVSCITSINFIYAIQTAAVAEFTSLCETWLSAQLINYTLFRNLVFSIEERWKFLKTFIQADRPQIPAFAYIFESAHPFYLRNCCSISQRWYEIGPVCRHGAIFAEMLAGPPVYDNIANLHKGLVKRASNN